MQDLASLPERGVLVISGGDRVAFLQGLVSNDVALVAPGRAVWAALLTAQGKWLADFFILADGDHLLLDCERAQVAMLAERLSRYRLRARVEVADASGEHFVHAAWGEKPGLPTGVVAAPDPRLPDAGWRVIAPRPLNAEAKFEDWDRHRLKLGLPDGTRDLEPERTLLLEAGFDELSGVSWSKGCYMGQELTARTRYRGLIKRRLVPVAVSGPLPAPATPVETDRGTRGSMRSGREAIGLATLRLDSLGERLTCGGAVLTPQVPSWMRLSA
ncbi:MAG: YgfZ/GcvT domain-containing protein [Acetobacteraceae bacterium]